MPVVGAGAWLWLQWNELAPAVQSTLRLLVFGIPLGTAAAGAYVGIVAAYNRLARLEIVKADKTIALTQAQRQLPDALTNLSYSFHDSRKALPAPEELVSGPQLPPPSVPTFGELLDKGRIGRELIIAYAAETGQPLTGSWKDLYSCGVGGWQGSGKSWLCAFILAQSAAMGGKLIICDPNPGTPESI